MFEGIHINLLFFIFIFFFHFSSQTLTYFLKMRHNRDKIPFTVHHRCKRKTISIAIFAYSIRLYCYQKLELSFYWISLMIYEFERIIVFIKTILKQHEETIQFLIKTCIVYVNELD